ncbi:MAG TPA: ATP-binding cassette domain-containing protein [Desulfonatronum sp.]|nr:ATP-binding cassette domain-containing protein [Desulfonatronum sp.]
MSLFELKGVRQIFDGRTVLDIDHLELSAGGSYALLGPNGCGKSTLLQILAFLRPPVHGEIYFKGRKTDWREKALHALRRQVVLVDQHPIMFTTTVINNVEYGLKMRGVPARERRKIAEGCLARVGMHAFAFRPAHLLSGGETQRVAIARALACSPEVMLFDEPTASVDVENQAVIEKVIQDIRREKGISLIFATHKRLEAVRLAEEKIFLFEGRLTGPGGENLFSGIVAWKGEHTVCRLGENVELDVKARHSGLCRMTIRPEGIRLFTAEQAKTVQSSSLKLYPGRVLQMTAEGEQIKILLDIGVPVRTLLSRKEAVQSGILVGDEVQVAIDSGATQVVQ